MIARMMRRLSARQWGVLLAVLGAGVVASALLVSTAGLYTTRTLITFSLPGAAVLDATPSEEPGIISFAVVVADTADLNDRPLHYAGADARPYGIGVRQGVFITVPDAGGQWSVWHRTATVAIDVVGPSLQWVEMEQQAAILRVERVAAAQQRMIGVPVQFRVVPNVEELSAHVEHVYPSPLSVVLALAALGGATALVAYALMTRMSSLRERAHR